MDELAGGVFGFIGLLTVGLLIHASIENQSGIAREQRQLPLMTAECAEKGGTLVRNRRDFNVAHHAYLALQYKCTLPDGDQVNLKAWWGNDE
jgi:hypothetical protein